MPALLAVESTVAISDWRPINRNSLLGSFTLTLPNGLMILGCMVHESANGPWIMLPGAPTVEAGELRKEENGKISYKTIVRFTTPEVWRAFQVPILEELTKLGHI